MTDRLHVGAFVTPQVRPAEDHVETSRRLVDRAAHAEAVGYDGVFVGEHIANEEWAFYEPLSLLAAMAERTDDLRLGTAISVAPLHHPVRYAARTATIDVLSGGRFVGGFGTGGLPHEFAAFEVPLAERISRTTETVEVVRRLWTEDRVDHDGEFFHLDGVSLHPKPAQEAVPVWLGFNGPEGMDYIAQEGVGWLALSQVPEDTWTERVGTFQDALARHDRGVEDVPMAAMVEVSVAEDRETAVESMREPVVEKYREYASRDRQPEAVRGMDPEDVTFEDVSDLFVIGTPEDAIEAFEAYREQGFDWLLLRPPAIGADESVVRGTMELIGEKVVPDVSG